MLRSLDGIGGAIWHVVSESSRIEDVLIDLRTHFDLDTTTPQAQVLALLRSQQRLIVLDNVESINKERRPDYIRLIGELHQAGATVLITSRFGWEDVNWICWYDLPRLPLDAACQMVLNMKTALEVKYDLTALAETIATAAKQHPELIEWAVGLMGFLTNSGFS